MGSQTSAVRRFFRVTTQAQTYRNLAYLILGLPIGTAWFSLIVTCFAVSASLVVVALIGVPLLLGCWYVVHGLAVVDRLVAIGLLDVDIDALAPIEQRRKGLRGRLRRASSDPARWRELLYLLLRFPAGIVTFSIAVTLPTVAATVAYTPFYLWLDETGWGTWPLSSTFGQIGSTWPWSWALVPIGALLALGSLHITNSFARACGRWTSHALAPRSRPLGGPTE